MQPPAFHQRRMQQQQQAAQVPAGRWMCGWCPGCMLLLSTLPGGMGAALSR
jgi:hypothetical protein